MRILLSLAVIVLLTACPGSIGDRGVGPAPETPGAAPGPNPVVRILPPISQNLGAHAYCKRDDEGNLNVQFQNIGDLDQAAGFDVTVTFVTRFGPVEETQPLEPLVVNQIGTLFYTIPPGCFDHDCSFTIEWSNQPAVDGICFG